MKTMHLVDTLQFDIKNERAVAGDRAVLFVSVSHARGDGEPPLPADLHPEDSEIPTWNDVFLSQFEIKRLS